MSGERVVVQRPRQAGKSRTLECAKVLQDFYVGKWVTVTPQEGRKFTGHLDTVHVGLEAPMLVFTVNGREYRLGWEQIARIRLHSSNAAVGDGE